MSEITVWVDDWQMQCCGTPFAIGDRVDWIVVPWGFERPPVAGLPPLDYYYEAHGGQDSPELRIKGVVTKLKNVYQVFERDTAKNIFKPVSGKLGECSGAATGWHPNLGEEKFSAYLVWLGEGEII